MLARPWRERSPDASWIQVERWNTLTAEEKKRFPPICPDFAIELAQRRRSCLRRTVELRSESDNLRSLQNKMQEYLNSGLRLGWLIDPKNRRVEIYRQGQEPEILENPSSLSGEDVLPEFVLDVQNIFKSDS